MSALFPEIAATASVGSPATVKVYSLLSALLSSSIILAIPIPVGPLSVITRTGSVLISSDEVTSVPQPLNNPTHKTSVKRIAMIFFIFIYSLFKTFKSSVLFIILIDFAPNSTKAVFSSSPLAL